MGNQLTEVHLRRITLDNYKECINLRLHESQIGLVATNAESLAEAYVDSNLVPLAIYDASLRGADPPEGSMIGFVMYEIATGVGFILRLMIDKSHQREGYGKATMLAVIRRLRLHPDVEMIATSHQRDNEAAGNLYRGLGFTEWDEEWLKSDTEVFLKLSQ
jgi:diamine N-acetyltransferase